MELPIDVYTLKARLTPALLTILPLIVTGITLFPQALDGWRSLYVVAATSGFLYLLSELSRRAGKRRQEKLFKAWGGKPSVALLRFMGARNRELVVERHRNLATLFPGKRIPSVKDEERDPQRADDIYEVLGQTLIERTRDKKLFPLLFKENCSYGFWRNLWSLKPFGIVACLVSLALVVGAALVKPDYFSTLSKKILIAPISLDAALLFVWMFWVRPSSVRIPAESYAERLLEACATLTRIEGKTL